MILNQYIPVNLLLFIFMCKFSTKKIVMLDNIYKPLLPFLVERFIKNHENCSVSMISVNIFFDEMKRLPLSHESKTLRRRVRNSCKTLQKVGLIQSKLDYTSKKIPFYTYKSREL